MLNLSISFYRSTFCLALVTITYLALAKLPESPINIWDKLLHAGAFATLLFLADRGFPDQNKLIHPLKAISLFFYGIWIEGMQSFLPYREASFFDLIADVVGLSAYISTKYLFLYFDENNHG